MTTSIPTVDDIFNGPYLSMLEGFFRRCDPTPERVASAIVTTGFLRVATDLPEYQELLRTELAKEIDTMLAIPNEDLLRVDVEWVRRGRLHRHIVDAARRLDVPTYLDAAVRAWRRDAARERRRGRIDEAERLESLAHHGDEFAAQLRNEGTTG